MMTWPELCEDKRFQDLPFKIEMNGRGQILMSPTHLYHGDFSYRIGRLLEDLLPGGKIIVECAVETADGVREADTAWLSRDLARKMRGASACPQAPEICVEVISKSNTFEEMMNKRQLFIAAGALEYWLCDRKGRLRFFDGIHELPRSRLCPAFPVQLPKDDFDQDESEED